MTAVIIFGCGGGRIDTRDDRAGLDTVPVVEILPPSLPPIGVAVADSGLVWCAEFPVDSAPPLQPGDRVTLVFPGPAPVAALATRLVGPMPGECLTAFPQPRWFDYRAYRLDADRPVSGSVPIVALAVASEAPWDRGDDGTVHADLDGDGSPEEARRCLADEGEHLTIWSTRPDGHRDRRAHEYFDWGAEVDADCGSAEDRGGS